MKEFLEQSLTNLSQKEGLNYKELKSLFLYVREREAEELKISNIKIMFPKMRSEKIREYLYFLEKALLITQIHKIDITRDKLIRGYSYLLKNSIRSRQDIRVMHTLKDNGFSIYRGIYKKKEVPIIAKKEDITIAFFFTGQYTISQIAKIPFNGTKCLVVKNDKIINFSSIKCLYEEEVITFSKKMVQKEIEL